MKKLTVAKIKAMTPGEQGALFLRILKKEIDDLDAKMVKAYWDYHIRPEVQALIDSMRHT